MMRTLRPGFVGAENKGNTRTTFELRVARFLSFVHLDNGLSALSSDYSRQQFLDVCTPPSLLGILS